MNSVESVLLENIDNPRSLFVFPTDIALSRWADHLLRIKSDTNSEVCSEAYNKVSGVIAMNKFIAWDKFKQNSIKSKVKNKKSIPSTLRKIFVSRLVRENSESVKQGKTPIFSSLISGEWAEQAQRFAPWLTDILPQLGAWFNKKTNLPIENILNPSADKLTSKFEGDDKDMYNFAYRYAKFLEEHSLFEPAWETPPFNSNGKECFIFFPEALSDFHEYSNLLTASDHVKIISIYGDNKHLISDTFYYTNSRSEITEAALYIRSLYEEHDINWESIAVCVPDSEFYEPYVMREFTNRNIPFVKRTSKPLSGYPAGSFFNAILDCTAQNYSFSSLVSLVLNKALPWKSADLIDQLIRFGIINNCLYSWTETKDNGKEQFINIWEDALNNPLQFKSGSQIDRITKVKSFFLELKKHLHSFRHAESFLELRKQYFIFREKFFDMEKWQEESNLIMSRCIAELMELTELEKNFPNTQVVDPLVFLTEHLNEVNYLAQTKSGGVSILPYKTAASAPFDCHIVLGAGQDNLSVVYSRLTFLSRKKREELGIFDEDASAAYVNLHKYNSLKRSAFFCCELSFSGFSIPHSKINAPSDPKQRYAANSDYNNYFSDDHYNTESIFCSSISRNTESDTDKTKISILHDNQTNGFTEWKNRRGFNSKGRKLKMYKEAVDFIKSGYIKSKESREQQLPGLSPTVLQSYYQCSLYWLFQRVFNLHNEQIETSLMDSSISGLVYHAILNNFFSELKKSGKPLLEAEQNDSGFSLSSGYHTLLQTCIDNIFSVFPALQPDNNQEETELKDINIDTGSVQRNKAQMSSLTAKLLSAAKKDFQYNLENFIIHFLSYFAGCGVVECEKYYETEKESYLLNGFVDLILKDPDNQYIIVDFKLKHTPNRDDCTGEGENGLSNFQLPAYITLVEEKEKYKVYTAAFYSILDTYPEVIIGTIYNINTEKTLPNRKDDQIIRDSEKYKMIFENFENKAKQFIKDISNGNLTVFPKNTNNCYSCDYHRICRTVYFIDHENINSLRKC